MKQLVFVCVLVAFFAASSGRAKSPQYKRTISCKTPAISASCYWTHGRLTAQVNGNPSFRLWKVGTKRVLGIYRGPSVDRAGLDSEGPELPANVEKQLARSKDPIFPDRVFADFEVCPLEPEKEGSMQAVCIESAKNIVVGK
jgi:hypothetical protein